MNKNIFKTGAFKILGNKFFIAWIIFGAWILFFDENSISRHLKDKQKLSEMMQQKAYYKERIAADKERYKELHKGKDDLEKFAREQYYMSKPDEDVFIVVEKGEK